MIKPTVGRVVWMRNRIGSISGHQPEKADIVFVHSDTCVNLSGYDANGIPWQLHSVTLVQEEMKSANWDETPHCEWMPYQIGQAKKHEAELAGITGTG